MQRYERSGHRRFKHDDERVNTPTLETAAAFLASQDAA